VAAIAAASSELEEAKRLMAVNIKNPDIGALLERAAAAEPRNPEPFHFLGRWAVANNRMSTAVPALEKAQALAPANTAAAVQNYTLLAAAFDGMARLTDAERAFRLALIANRKLPVFNTAAAYEFVRFLEREQRAAAALPIATEILRHDPQYGPALLSQARAASREGRHREAVRLAEACLASGRGSHSDQRAAHYLLAVAYSRLQQLEQAQQHRDWLTRDDQR
jgi:tetratricopeptide (TPR) repeat protein